MIQEYRLHIPESRCRARGICGKDYNVVVTRTSFRSKIEILHCKKTRVPAIKYKPRTVLSYLSFLLILVVAWTIMVMN